MTTRSRRSRPLAESPFAVWFVLSAVLLACPACDDAYFPLQPGEYGTRGVKIDDGPFTLEVIALRPSAVTTVSPGQIVSLGFTIECKSDKTIHWGLYFARDDGEISMIQILGCPTTGHPMPFAINWTIPKGSTEYAFGHGNTDYTDTNGLHGHEFDGLTTESVSCVSCFRGECRCLSARQQ